MRKTAHDKGHATLTLARRPFVSTPISRLWSFLLALPVVLLAERAWSYRWMSDDGFINLRVVDQVFANHGPVYNSGERVEAVTSPLWVAFLAVGHVLLWPLSLEWLAVVLGIALSVVGLAFMIGGGLSALDRAERGVRLPLGALTLAVAPFVWEFASSGLEGGLTLAWLGACFYTLSRHATSPRAERPVPSLRLAALVGLGPLVRPDFIIFSAVFLVLVLRGGRSRRAMAQLTLAWLALPLAYEVFRMGYYGALVPNSAFVKEGSRSRWGQGAYYLADFVTPYWLWMPLLGLAICGLAPSLRRYIGDRRPRRTERSGVAVAFVVSGCLYAAYVVYVGGDFMHARLLIPALFAVVAPVSVVATRRALEVFGAALVLGWCAVCAVALRPHLDTANSSPHEIADERLGTIARAGCRGQAAFVNQCPEHERHPVILTDFRISSNDLIRRLRHGSSADAGLYLGTTRLLVDNRPILTAPGQPRAIFLMFDGGKVPFALGPDAYVVDVRGLGDWLTARFELVERNGRPGHEKLLSLAWVHGRFAAPGQPVSPSVLTLWAATARAGPPEPVGPDFGPAVRAAARAVRCGKVRGLANAAGKPLTLRRFVANFWQAVNLYTFRVSSDPRRAAVEVCT